MDAEWRRWGFVVVAAAVMGAAGFYQFGWSSLRGPLAGRIGATETALGTVFTLFVVSQTLAQFPAGWVRDRWGPRLPLLACGALLAAGFAGTALSDSILGAAAFYALGGAGSGVAYTVAVNTPVKWFDERRGLATGAVAMSYSGVAFLLIPVVRRGVAGAFVTTLLALAALAGVVGLAAAVVLRDPGDESEEGAADDEGSAYTWRETIRTWQFWLLYGVFAVVNGVGLMVVGKVVTFAAELGLAAAAATAAASAVALADAAGVAVGGGLSDVLGPRRTVSAMLVLCGLSLAGSVAAADSGSGLAFVALVGAAAFFRSPPFGVFPAIVGDYYGAARSSENYAALYTAKLWGGVGGGVAASALILAVGWSRAFLFGAALLVVAGVAMSFLRPVE